MCLHAGNRRAPLNLLHGLKQKCWKRAHSRLPWWLTKEWRDIFCSCNKSFRLYFLVSWNWLEFRITLAKESCHCSGMFSLTISIFYSDLEIMRFFSLIFSLCSAKAGWHVESLSGLFCLVKCWRTCYYSANCLIRKLYILLYFHCIFNIILFNINLKETRKSFLWDCFSEKWLWLNICQKLIVMTFFVKIRTYQCKLPNYGKIVCVNTVKSLLEIMLFLFAVHVTNK